MSNGYIITRSTLKNFIGLALRPLMRAGCVEKKHLDAVRKVGDTAVSISYGTYDDKGSSCGCPITQAGMRMVIDWSEQVLFTDVFDRLMHEHLDRPNGMVMPGPVRNIKIIN